MVLLAIFLLLLALFVSMIYIIYTLVLSGYLLPYFIVYGGDQFVFRSQHRAEFSLFDEMSRRVLAQNHAEFWHKIAPAEIKQ